MSLDRLSLETLHLQYLQTPWLHLWAPPWGGAGRSCCPLAWWLCCCLHGPAAPSASALRFHMSSAWRCHKPRELPRLRGSTWTTREQNINQQLVLVSACWFNSGVFVGVSRGLGSDTEEIKVWSWNNCTQISQSKWTLTKLKTNGSGCGVMPVQRELHRGRRLLMNVWRGTGLRKLWLPRGLPAPRQKGAFCSFNHVW